MDFFLFVILGLAQVRYCSDCPSRADSVCIGNGPVQAIRSLPSLAVNGSEVYIRRGKQKGFYFRVRGEWHLVPTTEYTVKPYKFPCGNKPLGTWHQRTLK